MTDSAATEASAHYEASVEADRLDLPLGRVEYARTIELLTPHLPVSPATIADIGGGPGRYAAWLAGLGYRVHHRDLMSAHVEHARAGDTAGLDDPDARVAAMEADGVMPPLYPGSFCGYAHRPEELRTEIAAAGLLVEDLVGVEGLALALPDLEQRLGGPVDREMVFAAARAVQRVPDLLGLGPHLLAVARVP